MYETNEKYRRGVSGSRYAGIIKNTEHGDISFDSLLELSFIIEMMSKKLLNFKRFDKPIEYIYENKTHKYYPDFIINDKYVVEVKSYGLFKKNYDSIIEKCKAARTGCSSNNLVYSMGFDSNDTKVKINNFKNVRRVIGYTNYKLKFKNKEVQKEYSEAERENKANKKKTIQR